MFPDRNLADGLFERLDIEGWYANTLCNYIYEPPSGKTNNVVSDQVRHKPACTVTKDSYKLEILDLECRGILLSV